MKSPGRLEEAALSQAPIYKLEHNLSCRGAVRITARHGWEALWPLKHSDVKVTCYRPGSGKQLRLEDVVLVTQGLVLAYLGSSP